MKKIDVLIDQTNKIVPFSKTSIVVTLLLIFVIFWGAFRSCSSGSSLDKTKTFVIARDPSWYPLNLMGKPTNVLAFTNDLLLTIAKDRDVRLKLIAVGGNSLLEGLNLKEYDAIISSILPNPINNQIYNFSNTLFFIGPVLIVPSNSKITSFNDMADKVVGVPYSYDITIDISKYKSYYKPYEGSNEAFNDLSSGQVDGILLPVMQAYAYIDSLYKGTYKIISPPLSEQGLRIVTRQTEESEYIIEEFNIGLKKLIEDGTYGNLCKKWGLPDPFSYVKS